MKRFWCLFLPLIITACHSKDELKLPEVTQGPTATITIPIEKPSEFSKLLRETIYFANSLEREALKLITKDSSFQKLTLFSVLSYVVETSSGAKKSTPLGLDCGQFTVRKNEKEISILKSCSKPFLELVHIHIVDESEKSAHYEFNFVINEWSSVLGMPVTLTGSNVRCQMQVKDAKLKRLNCDNWSYLISEDQLSATVVKTKEFLFEREAQKQFVIRGGYFKELIENKKFDITVPLEGKIKIIEKEIRVIDEFLDKKNEVQNEKESSPEKIEAVPEISKEDYQKIIKEGLENQTPDAQIGEESKEVSTDDSSARGRRGR